MYSTFDAAEPIRAFAFVVILLLCVPDAAKLPFTKILVAPLSLVATKKFHSSAGGFDAFNEPPMYKVNPLGG